MKGVPIFNQGRRTGFRFLLILSLLLHLISSISGANIVLVRNNVTLSFEAVEAYFTPRVKKSGECGVLYIATPIHACSPLLNTIDPIDAGRSPYVLIERGVCDFEEKVRRAQAAGFKAAIIYNNEYDSYLLTMSGSSSGIKIHASFINRVSGEVLKKFVGYPNVNIWLFPTFQNPIYGYFSISLFVMSAFLAACFFVRRYCRRCNWFGASSRVQEFQGGSTSTTCVICLEDYSVGENIKVLPCGHKFHAACVDSWLKSWKRFCPVCKRDTRTSTSDPPASERTPLHSSSTQTPSQTGRIPV